MRAPVMLLNSSQKTCDVEPSPEDATVIASGLTFAAAISSGTECTEDAGCTTSTFIASMMLATGAVSCMKLNLSSL
jgi:hypothetical protein